MIVLAASAPIASVNLLRSVRRYSSPADMTILLDSCVLEGGRIHRPRVIALKLTLVPLLGNHSKPIVNYRTSSNL